MLAHQDHPRYVLAVLHVGCSDGEVHVGQMWQEVALRVLDVRCAEPTDGCDVKYEPDERGWMPRTDSTQTPTVEAGRQRPPPGRRGPQVR